MVNIKKIKYLYPLSYKLYTNGHILYFAEVQYVNNNSNTLYAHNLYAYFVK